MAEKKTTQTTLTGPATPAGLLGAQDAAKIATLLPPSELLQPLLDRPTLNPFQIAAGDLAGKTLGLDPTTIGQSTVNALRGPFDQIGRSGLITPSETAALTRQMGQPFVAPTAQQVNERFAFEPFTFPDNFAANQSPPLPDLSSVLASIQEGLVPTTVGESLGLELQKPPTDAALAKAVALGDNFSGSFTFDGASPIEKNAEGNQFVVGNVTLFAPGGDPSADPFNHFIQTPQHFIDNLVRSNILTPIQGLSFGASLGPDQTVGGNIQLFARDPVGLQELLDNDVIGEVTQNRLISDGIAARDNAGHIFVKGAQSRRWTPVNELTFIESTRLPAQPSLFNERLNLPGNVLEGLGKTLF